MIDVGLNEIVIWDPKPLADSAIAELNPPVTALLIVTVPELFRAILTELGDAPSEKPAFGLFTVRATVAVCVVLPEVPVTVIV